MGEGCGKIRVGADHPWAAQLLRNDRGCFAHGIAQQEVLVVPVCPLRAFSHAVNGDAGPFSGVATQIIRDLALQRTAI